MALTVGLKSVPPCAHLWRSTSGMSRVFWQPTLAHRWCSFHTISTSMARTREPSTRAGCETDSAQCCPQGGDAGRRRSHQLPLLLTLPPRRLPPLLC